MGSTRPPQLYHDSASNVAKQVNKSLQTRWENSPKEYKQRLEKCWGYTDCGDCHRSEGFCGWCAISNTCLPLPTDPVSSAFPLLSPLRYKFICATGPERFELRTAGLGCQVSTITFLTAVVTIFATLTGLVGLLGFGWCVKRLLRYERGRKGGWRVGADGMGEVWVRRGRGGWLGGWGRKGSGRNDEGEERALLGARV
ncbi:hypothetical protein M011DRAFT_448206 [Sporormia fimetaria CBS 119925]|uniref:PSI domain-containing protein n=1 Tax=Sporormia fimetaria CBS 119925 TaxID=1340428 RepID=A0A6A6V4S9_9PLEO|nr:hypothetical protein M011DRAFT_448206 [Sporormia fimetaria CBS 119925]